MGFGWSGDCDPQHNHQLPRWRTMSQEDERTRSYSRKLILYRRADKHGIDGEEKMQKQSMMIYRQLLSYRDLLRRNARKLLGSKAFLSEKSKLCKPWWDQARPRTQGQWTGNQIWSISLVFLTVVKAASLNLWFMFLALPDWGNVLSTENKQDYSSKQYRPVAILLWGYLIEQPGGVSLRGFELFLKCHNPSLSISNG